MQRIATTLWRSVSSFLSVLWFVSQLALVFGPIPAAAQNVATGTVQGQVTDPSGAAIPGATVTLIDPSTNTPLTQTTNADGRYTFPNVNPGHYNLEVSKQGFATARLTNQAVEVGLSLTLNVTLQVGTTSTTVEVQAQAGAELQTMNATVGSDITGASIQMMPNLGRDANAFVTLQPGVTPTGEVAGLPMDTSSFQLDGGVNTNDMDGSQSIYTPSSGYIGPGATGGIPSGVMPTPAESIEEFKVATSNQTADFNQAGGAQVQMVTKRGTNTWHGSAYEYFLSSYFGANFWANNHTPDPQKGLAYTPLPPSHQNRFGASLGGPLFPNFLGGKWYFFANYEGRRFPQSTTITRIVPTATLRAGIIIENGTPYNINPYPLTVNGVTYPACPAGANYCDPRGLGMNSLVSTIWNKYMPLPNNPSFGDGVNTQGYLSAISLPQNSDFGVIRVDHDFGSKWHLMSSYRYYSFTQNTTSQVDIGGLLCGSLGQACSTALRPQKPWFLVIGLTGTLTPNTTNDLHVSYLRNFWQWGTDAAPPQLPGVGGALEIGGEILGSGNATGANINALIPYNVDTQNTRQRFWDGKDKAIRDDLSTLHGNHLFQFGGSYQRNFDYHERNDNGAGIDVAPTYQIGYGPGVDNSGTTPAAVASAGLSKDWSQYYNEILGIVSQPQVMYSRAGSNLALQPIGTPLFDKSIIPTYEGYASDTWHLRKNLTLTAGVNYTLEMPPYELNGKQVELVNTAGQPITLQNFLQYDQFYAENGRSYAPIIGSDLIRNVNGDKKYPYHPFYDGISPRAAIAWNITNNTVLRGGYSRIYGRLNGVDLVLIPLLGTGLAQTAACVGASMTGQCLGTGGVTPATAFRIGTDGLTAPLPSVSQTLAQPFFSGVGGNPPSGVSTYLDPNFKPDRSDQFDFTIQRSLGKNVIVEVGYIGRIIRNEWQQLDIDTVPTPYTLDGQTFAQAFAQMYLQANMGQIPQSQPWFNAALGGPTSAYCAGFANCTAAVVAKNKAMVIGQPLVYDLWTALSASPSWTLGRTLLSSPVGPGLPGQTNGAIFFNGSIGYGNYNAGFISTTFRDWHGITAHSNFTWSKALGTGTLVQATSEESVIDPFHLQAAYGPQTFDAKFVYNLNLLWQTPWFREQKGILGRLLGGWNIAPLFTANSGFPLTTNIDGDCESFGEMNCNGGATFENAVPITPYTAGNSAHTNVTGTGNVASAGNPANGGSGVNMFANPTAVFNQFRYCVLGYDVNCGMTGNLRGFPFWNLDLSVSKDFRIAERFSATFMVQISNVLNHFQPENPVLDITSPQIWGVVTGQAEGASPDGVVPAELPRQIEFGLRIHW